jgi:hypothetical protein
MSPASGPVSFCVVFYSRQVFPRATALRLVNAAEQQRLAFRQISVLPDAYPLEWQIPAIQRSRTDVQRLRDHIIWLITVKQCSPDFLCASVCVCHCLRPVIVCRAISMPVI